MSAICVFCSASDHVDPFFFSEMETLGGLLAKAGVDVWYGGASVGLMGKLADTVLKKGGVVKGIRPRDFEEKEALQKGLHEVVMVDTLVQRKETMLAKADAFIGCPGGTGTVGEVMEVIAHRQVGLIKKPMILLNTLGFWSGLMDMLTEMQKQKMINIGLEYLFDVVTEPKEALALLKKYRLVYTETISGQKSNK